MFRLVLLASVTTLIGVGCSTGNEALTGIDLEIDGEQRPVDEAAATIHAIPSIDSYTYHLGIASGELEIDVAFDFPETAGTDFELMIAGHALQATPSAYHCGGPNALDCMSDLVGVYTWEGVFSGQAILDKAGVLTSLEIAFAGREEPGTPTSVGIRVSGTSLRPQACYGAQTADPTDCSFLESVVPGGTAP